VLTAKSGPETYKGGIATRYENVSFTSNTDCSYISPISNSMTFETTLTVTPNDTIKVSWTTSSALDVTASVQCPGSPTPPPPIPGQPGPQLILPTPTSFDLPLTGGVQTIGGGFQVGGDGWVHSGTITVKKIPN
jgi:hypothetical protein